MGVAKVGVRIGRPVEDVFGVLTHVENVPKWNRNAIDVKLLTPGPMRVGSRRQATIRGFAGRPTTNIAEMVEFEPNRRMLVQCVEGQFTWQALIELAPIPEGTALDWTWTFARTGGLLRVLDPFVPALMRRSFQRDLNDLKRLMEAGSL